MTSATSATIADALPAGRAVEMQRRWRRVQGPLIGVGSIVLALLALGVPGTLVLGSGWLLAAATSRILPRFRGAASWAIAIVVEFGLLFVLSATVAFLSPHLHSRWVNVAILLIPALIGGTALLLSAKFVDNEDATPGRWRVAAAIQAVSLGVALWVATRRTNNGVAWAMSGDARLHVDVMRDILTQGGVTVDALKALPVAVNAFAALLAGAGDRGGAVGEVIINDASALATTYTLAAIATALMLAGALLEVLPLSVRTMRRLPGAVFVTILAASALAASPYVLGMALADGFVTTYSALPLALAAVVLALRFQTRPNDPITLIVMSAATLLTFVSWTVLVVVPGAVLVLTVVSEIRDSSRSRTAHASVWHPSGSVLRWVGIAVALVTLLALVLVIGDFWWTLSDRLASLGGSARRPFIFMPFVLGLATLGLAFSGDTPGLRRQMRVPLAVALASLVTLIWLVYLPGLGITWTYYALKANWIFCASLLWVVFVPVATWAARERESERPRAFARRRSTVGAAALSCAIVVLVGSATTAPEPLLNAARGWTQPSAPIVTAAMNAADQGTPFVFWEWSDPGNDRLGNFWAALAWGNAPEYAKLDGMPADFSYWAYMYTWQISDLCTLTSAVPEIVVETHDVNLDNSLTTSCPAGAADVEVRDGVTDVKAP